jgi:hypothetical protein
MIYPTVNDLGRQVFWLNPAGCGQYATLKWFNHERAEIDISIPGSVIHQFACAELMHLSWLQSDNLVFTQTIHGNFEPQPENTGMNYSTAALMLNPNCRAIKVSYEKDKDGKPINLMVKKTIDDTIKVGDIVITETKPDHRYGFTICAVVEVDVEWEHSTHEDITWIMGKVDMAAFEKLKSADNEFIALAKKADNRAKADEMRERMLKHINPDDLKGLSISKLSGDDIKTIEHDPK